jgi:hypothetical protein
VSVKQGLAKEPESKASTLASLNEELENSAAAETGTAPDIAHESARGNSNADAVTSAAIPAANVDTPKSKVGIDPDDP